MVRSAAPLRAFQLMDDMNLLPMVFPLPEDFVLHMDDDQTRAYEFGMVYLKVRYRSWICVCVVAFEPSSVPLRPLWKKFIFWLRLVVISSCQTLLAIALGIQEKRAQCSK